MGGKWCSHILGSDGQGPSKGNGGFDEEHYERTCVDSQLSYVLSYICDQSDHSKKG